MITTWHLYSICSSFDKSFTLSYKFCMINGLNKFIFWSFLCSHVNFYAEIKSFSFSFCMVHWRFLESVPNQNVHGMQTLQQTAMPNAFFIASVLTAETEGGWGWAWAPWASHFLLFLQILAHFRAFGLPLLH